MGDLFLHAWDATTDKWIKVQSDANGLLKIDPSEFLQNPPVEDETKKTATSEWLYDHWKNTAAHHAKYTDINSRAAIGGLFNSVGGMVKNLDCGGYQIQRLQSFKMRYSTVDTHYMFIICETAGNRIKIIHHEDGVGDTPAFIDIFDGTDYGRVVVLPVMTAAISTHKDIANAHHDKYTDTNAKAACNLDGFRYWSRPGNGFIATDPQKDNYTRAVTGELIVDENGIDFMVAVNLPDLCTVTGCIIGGNAGLADKTWALHRFRHSDMLQGKMATAAGNTEATTISYSVIYNSTYGYCLHIEDLDITDEIHYARISFTISDV